MKPLILVLEDMHWADSASLALLHYISRAILNEKILVLVTFRREEIGRDAEGRLHPLADTLNLMGREGLFQTGFPDASVVLRTGGRDRCKGPGCRQRRFRCLTID